MKKTISINIAGQIFHIEEDGYEKLRNYLNSIQKYFATYEDSKEIVSDIEGRIAEKFINNQKTTDQQAITLQDVDGLIASMGTVADFEAIEEEEDLSVVNSGTPVSPQSIVDSGTTSNSKTQDSSTESESAIPPVANRQSLNPNQRPLVRDKKRKLLGGVCAGIAHYFNVDPLFIRLIFLFLFLGFPALGGIIGNNADEFFGPFSGIIFLAYVAIWVSFPASTTLEEDKSIKKFYRDTDKKVLGGVAGGVAAYFGTDIGIVRLLWVLSVLFFGTGLIFYVILWAITPKAQTLTEKMEMTGQPITLENIETNVKQALQPDTQHENTFTKLLLLPFRIIATVFNGLTPLAKFFVSAIRIFAGLIMLIVGVSAVFSLIVALFAFVGGWGSWGSIEDIPFPANFFLQEVSPIAYLFLILAIGIPFAVVAWVGMSLVSNQNKFTSATWQTMLGLFLVGIIGTSIFAGKYGREFRTEGTFEKTEEYALPKNTLLLEINNNIDRNYNNLDFDVAGYEGEKVKVNLSFEAQGRNKVAAQNNAKAMIYSIVQSDSVLKFDEHFAMPASMKFRGQRLNIDLYLPYNKAFRMSRDFYNHFRLENDQQKNYDLEKDNEETFKSINWAMTKDSGLVCLNRQVVVDDDNNDDENDDNNDTNIEQITTSLGLGFDEAFDQSFEEKGEFTKSYDVKDFDRISIGGAYIVKIQSGSNFKVEADGRQKDIDDIEVKVNGGLLKIRKDGGIKLFDNQKRIGLTITMPTVKEIELAGATKARITEFRNLKNLNVHISGASKSYVDVTTQDLDVELAGAGKMKLSGKADRLSANLSGACKLDATQMKINEADVSAAGASKAEMGKIKNLKSNTSGVSKISSKNQ